MNLDPEKILVLLVIALLVLGPDRLPHAARTLGKGLAEMRRYTAAFRAEVDEVLAEPRAAVRSAMQEADVRDQLRREALAANGQAQPALGPAAPGAIVAREGAEGPPAAREAAAPVPAERLALPPGVPDDPSLN